MLDSPSSSTNPRDSTSLANRLKTIFKKAYELFILCEIEICVIHYGPDGKLQTWPEERQKVKDMALRYDMATKRKNNLTLHEFLEKKKKKDKKDKKTKRDLRNVKEIKYPDWYPIFDHYSLNQLSQLIQSLELTLSTLQERLRFVEAQKQRNTNLGLTPSSLNQHHQYQTQPLNPNQFSLFMYNHGDATLSHLPLSASHSNYQNHLMQQDLYGFDQNINNNNFLQQPPCLTVQESAVNNYGFKNHLMQQNELYGSHQNMCMMNDNINDNILEQTGLSNTVPDEFCSDFKSPYGDMISSNGFSKDFPDLFSSYDESSLTQTSSLPPLHTIPNNYLLNHNSRIL